MRPKRRLTGKRTPEEDGLVVFGLDIEKFAAAEEPEDSEVVIDEPDGCDLDELIDRCVMDPRNRIAIHLARIGKGRKVVSEIIDVPETVAHNILLIGRHLLRASWRLQLIEEREEVGWFRRGFSRLERLAWDGYCKGLSLDQVAELVGLPRSGRSTKAGKATTATGLIVAVQTRARAKGLEDYLDAVDEARRFRMAGL